MIRKKIEGGGEGEEENALYTSHFFVERKIDKWGAKWNEKAETDSKVLF